MGSGRLEVGIDVGSRGSEKDGRAKTIRRKVLCVPGNIVGNGRYRHVRLAANKWLETVINQVKTNLDEFLYLVVQRLYPIRC